VLIAQSDLGYECAHDNRYFVLGLGGFGCGEVGRGVSEVGRGGQWSAVG
jgi:hypothetical protein